MLGRAFGSILPRSVANSTRTRKTRRQCISLKRPRPSTWVSIRLSLGKLRQRTCSTLNTSTSSRTITTSWTWKQSLLRGAEQTAPLLSICSARYLLALMRRRPTHSKGSLSLGSWLVSLRSTGTRSQMCTRRWAIPSEPSTLRSSTLMSSSSNSIKRSAKSIWKNTLSMGTSW